MEPNRVSRWTSAALATRTGISRTTLIHTVIPKMQAAGVLNRIGKQWHGRAADIDAWLLGTWKGQP